MALMKRPPQGQGFLFSKSRAEKNVGIFFRKIPDLPKKIGVLTFSPKLSGNREKKRKLAPA
jgi:hypothetical protein